jgi:hypothetical protein
MLNRPKPRYRGLLPGDTVYLYAIRCEEFFKVGIAVNIAERVRIMLTGNPFPIEVAAYRTIRHEVAYEAESAAHAKLAPFAHRGEWFRCSLDDARAALNHGQKVAMRLRPIGFITEEERQVLADKAAEMEAQIERMISGQNDKNRAVAIAVGAIS